MARIEVKSVMAGSVWKIDCNVGDEVSEDDPIIILESMKMEIPLTAPEDGRVVEILVKEGDPIAEDQVVAMLEN
jgi:acetyl-CoA carboxylase biotin carboxyl carrier protein